MAVTMTEIKNLLGDLNIKYYADECCERLLMPHLINRQHVNIHIRLYDGGKHIYIGIPHFLFLDRPLNREQSYEKILMLNDRLKIGKFSLSDNKESVWLESGLPIEDNDVTKRQLRRIIGALKNVCRNDRASLQHFIDTSIDSMEEMDDIVRKLLSYPISEETAQPVEDTSGEVEIAGESVDLAIEDIDIEDL